MNAVDRIREYILDGDIYQANISQSYSAQLHGPADPVGLFLALRAANPAPFSALLWPAIDRYTMSCSPERFLLLQNGLVETRPIKGTRERGKNAICDRHLRSELLASGKDKAENTMIVDLLRNDLSRVCRAGSVRVDALCRAETFSNVHHLVSVVRGELEPGCDALGLLDATFPGGSITGAPKIRAMELIKAIEKRRRGVYCGAIGYFDFSGDIDLNIAIRTVEVERHITRIGAGAGIILRSDSTQDFDETVIKVERLLSTLFDSTPANVSNG